MNKVGRLVKSSSYICRAFNGQKCLRLLVLWPRFMARAYEWVVWGTVGLNGKKNSKNSWNWLIILMPETVRQTLNINVWNLRKRKLCEYSAWKYLWNHIKWTYFRRVLPIWNHCVGSVQCESVRHICSYLFNLGVLEVVRWWHMNFIFKDLIKN